MRGDLPTKILIVLFLLAAHSQAIELILRPNYPVCTVLLSSSDPIKLQLKVPTIVGKRLDERLEYTLTNIKTEELMQQKTIEDGKTLRQNLFLTHHELHNFCIQLISPREPHEKNVLLINFYAEEHFQESLGKVQVPQELQGEQHLRNIYETGSRMSSFVAQSTQRQRKEREIEDRLVNLSAHKTQRIITITVIECLVIVLSGAYQIFALRNFLIDKNLY